METTRQITVPPGLPVTAAQWDYLRGIQRRLHLPDRMLESHCLARFDRTCVELDRADVSRLIDEMKGWEGSAA